MDALRAPLREFSVIEGRAKSVTRKRKLVRTLASFRVPGRQQGGDDHDNDPTAYKNCDHHTGTTSLGAPKGVAFNRPSGSVRWSFLAIDQSAVSQVSHSSGSVKMTGIALEWIGLTSALGSVVRKA